MMRPERKENNLRLKKHMEYSFSFAKKVKYRSDADKKKILSSIKNLKQGIPLRKSYSLKG